MKRAAVPSILVVVVLLTVAVIAEAQQAKVTKIGWLGTRPASGTSGSSGMGVVLELNRQALRDLGYIEGKNIVFEYRHADNKLERLPALADELVRLKVDVIFTPGINEALAAKNATRTIPVVFSTTADPVAAGLVDSLARPGGNITGFTYIGAVLSGKRLELLKETVPKLSRPEYCGIHKIQPPHNNGKKANCQHANWVCNLIPWRSAAQTNTRERSKMQLKRVALLSP